MESNQWDNSICDRRAGSVRLPAAGPWCWDVCHQSVLVLIPLKLKTRLEHTGRPFSPPIYTSRFESY